MTQLTTVPFRCRFDTVSSEAIVSGPQGEFCAFEFPGCRGCKFAVDEIGSVRATEDPMRSLSGADFFIAASCVAREARHGNPFASRKNGIIHRENMAIFKKRLAETKDATIRAMLQRLLTAEQAKDVTPKAEK